MRDLFFVGFLAAFLALGLRRPFLFVLAYAYVDIVAPQRLSYYLLNSIPVSMIVAALAVAGWLVGDARRGVSFSGRQGLILLLLAYAGFTTLAADFPEAAVTKWAWVWKAVFWSLFLPLVLRTRIRIEAYLLVMILSAAAIIIVGGIKTLASGGGYGALNLMVDNNTGLYEGSTISCFAVAIVPIILWLGRYGTIFPRDWRVRLFAAALIFACLLIPVGTEARTGLVCIAVLAILLLRDVKRRLIYIGALSLAAVAVIPFLPQTFTNRMETIQTPEEDSSASTRLAVWAWTWSYVQDHPLGGGFDAYLQNEISFEVRGGPVTPSTATQRDSARAYHSAYFEMLGEQGYPGLALFLLIHLSGLVGMERIRRRYRSRGEDEAWVSPLATALQSGEIIYLVGGAFLGIAWQPFIYMLIGVQMGFVTWVRRRERAASGKPRPIALPFAAQSARN